LAYRGVPCARRNEQREIKREKDVTREDGHKSEHVVDDGFVASKLMSKYSICSILVVA
jgi:hypothetical protein